MRYKLLYLWQLPQHIVGLLLVWWYKPTRTHKAGDVTIYYSHLIKGGISLGNYIIVHDGHYRKHLADSWARTTVRHEYGHSYQSLYLGWLYLFVIGLPSLIWAAFCNDKKKYYKFYTERCADKIMGIKRGV